MEEIIQKIHSVKLRNWALVTILLLALSFAFMIIGRNANSLVFGLICGSIANLALVSSLAVYAINDKKITKTVIILACIALCIQIFGIYKAFDNPWIEFSRLGPDNYNELVQYVNEKMAIFVIIQNIVLLIGFLYGLTALKEPYKTGWILFTCAFLLSFLNSIIFTPSNVETYANSEQVTIYGIIALITSILQLIGLIMLFRIKEPLVITYDFTKSGNKGAIPSQNISINTKSESLIDLKSLYDSDLITQTEFNTNKSKVLYGDDVSVQKIKELTDLKKLLDAGIINKTEFDTQKKKILSDTTTTDKNVTLTSNSNKKLIWIIIGVVVVIAITAIALSKNKTHHNNGYNGGDSYRDVPAPFGAYQAPTTGEGVPKYNEGTVYPYDGIPDDELEEDYSSYQYRTDSYDSHSNANAWN